MGNWPLYIELVNLCTSCHFSLEEPNETKWNEMNFKVWGVKRLMELRVHHGGFKPARVSDMANGRHACTARGGDIKCCMLKYTMVCSTFPTRATLYPQPRWPRHGLKRERNFLDHSWMVPPLFFTYIVTYMQDSCPSLYPPMFYDFTFFTTTSMIFDTMFVTSTRIEIFERFITSTTCHLFDHAL